jgi:hypothetical protein
MHRPHGLLWFALSAGLVFVSALAVPGSDAKAATNFKQDQRVNSLVLQYTTDAFAPNNRFGSAFAGSIARSTFQSSLDTGIANGSISVLLRMLGLNDLSGTNEPSLVVGVVGGAPTLPPGNPTTYNGASDLDWWYSQNANEIDANGNPLTQFTGAIASNTLTAGPGNITFGGGAAGTLALSNARIVATTGTVSTPLTSSNGFPPGHLPSEGINPSLQSFASMSAGKLAGNIGIASLASAPIPSALVGTGLTNCTQGYSASNTLLDLFVGGCNVFILGSEITPTQPDQSDPAAPVAGAGAPYTLTRTGNAVTGCHDRNAAIVDLSTCLNAAAYSAYFQFTSDRVIIPGAAPRDHKTDANGDGYSAADEATSANCGVASCGSLTSFGTSETNTCKDGITRHCGAPGAPADDSVPVREAPPPADGYGCDVTLDTVGPKTTKKLAQSDVDLDGVVTILDLSKVASWFGNTINASVSDPRWEGDMDGDGHITILDLSAMASNFGRSVAGDCQIE